MLHHNHATRCSRSYQQPEWTRRVLLPRRNRESGFRFRYLFFFFCFFLLSFFPPSLCGLSGLGDRWGPVFVGMSHKDTGSKASSPVPSFFFVGVIIRGIWGHGSEESSSRTALTA